MPELGDKSTCRMCGEEIEYIGPYWRHTQSNPRHPALPVEIKAETDNKEVCNE